MLRPDPYSVPWRWHKALQRKREEREKSRLQLLTDLSGALQALEKKYTWDETYLFGSIVHRGRFNSRSDIDIAVRGLNKFDYYAFVGDISQLLNKSVDVVRLEECHFSASITTGGVRWTPKKTSLSS